MIVAVSKSAAIEVDGLGFDCSLVILGVVKVEAGVL